VKSAELLAAAELVMDRPDFGFHGAWPRAVALLGRQALEGALDEYWERWLPQMQTANRRTQTACLDLFVRDPDLSDGVKVAWASLSRACHHHAYELSPTAAELEMWLAKVEGLVSRLSKTASGTVR